MNSNTSVDYKLIECQLLTQQAQLNRELAESKERARKLDEKYKAFSDSNDPLHELSEQLTTQVKKIEELELKCEFYQKASL
jgi:hypothetical protein